MDEKENKDIQNRREFFKHAVPQVIIMSGQLLF